MKAILLFIGVMNPIKNLKAIGIGNCVDESIDKGRSYVIRNENVVIENCVFLRIDSYEFDGGVIFCEGSSMLNICCCIFSNCSTNGKGGAVYFSSKSINITNVCCLSCRAMSYGHFFYAEIGQYATFSRTTISQSAKSWIGFGSMYLVYSVHLISDSNSSNNMAYQVSVVDFRYSSVLNLTYFNCINNSGKSICINFYGELSNNGVMYSNIIKNSSPASFGIINNLYYYIVINCIFSQNNNILFHSEKGTLTVINSFFDGNIVTYGPVIISGTLIQSHAFFIEFFKTAYCYETVTPPRTYDQFCIITEHVDEKSSTINFFPIYVSLVMLIDH